MSLLRVADELRDVRRAQKQMQKAALHNLDPRLPAGVVPGLPAIGNTRNRNAFSTVTQTIFDNPPSSASVAGAPSIKIERLENGGVAVVISRNARYPGLIDDDDLEGWRTVGQRMVARAQAQSRGPLRPKDLRRQNHPYGRGLTPQGTARGKLGNIGHVKGVRGAVPNLSIINSAGDFAKEWRYEVFTTDTGAQIRLINDSPHAAVLALGTRKMRAHGPFASTVAAFQTQINSEWQKAIRRAYHRKALEYDLMTSLGG